MTNPSHIMLAVDQRVEDENLYELVKKIWNLEYIGINDNTNKLSKYKKCILERFEKNIKFDGSNYAFGCHENKMIL